MTVSVALRGGRIREGSLGRLCRQGGIRREHSSLHEEGISGPLEQNNRATDREYSGSYSQNKSSCSCTRRSRPGDKRERERKSSVRRVESVATAQEWFTQGKVAFAQKKSRTQMLWVLTLSGDWHTSEETAVPHPFPHMMRVPVFIALCD